MSFIDYAKGYRAGCSHTIELMETMGVISKAVADRMLAGIPMVVNEALKEVIDTIELESIHTSGEPN